MTRGKSKKISNFEFRIMRHLRKHQDRWFTTTQLSRRLRVGYAITGIILRKFKKDGKIILTSHKKDFKGYPENIYKYQRDALDNLIK